MRPYQREVSGTVAKRLKEKRHFLQVIIGPRQVGKTTAIQQILAERNAPSHYAAADLPAPPATEWIARQWESARMKQAGHAPAVLVLDEIQKIAHWSTEVKRLWDEDTRARRPLHVVLLGSSSLLIQKSLEESLAGRFELIRFPHWSWTECRDAFGWSLDQYVYFGGYPGSSVLIREEDRWGRYIRDSLIEMAVSKDILLINRVEKPALLRQLFVLACEYGGQYHHAGPLPEAPGVRLPDQRLAQVGRDSYPAQELQPQVAALEHSPHDGPVEPFL